MSDERDELADVIKPAAAHDYWPTKAAELVLAAGYRKPRHVTTVEEIKNLPALTVVIYDDMANGGLLQTYVVPDDGTVMFKERYPFHLMTFAGDYINAEDMPLPLTVVYEVGA